MNSKVLEFQWRDGELCIAGAGGVVRIRAWPEPRALLETGTSPPSEIRPEMRLLKPEISDPEPARDSVEVPLSTAERSKIEAFGHLRRALPPAVVSLVERFQSHQWNLIDLLSKDEAACDLASANPTLFYCLANNDQFIRLFRITPAEKAVGRASRRRREIAGWLGFPETDAVVKLLCRIPPDCVTPHEIRLMRQALKSEPIVQDLLAHIRMVNSGVLGLVCNLKLLPLITPRLLAEVAAAEDERVRSHSADLLVDALYIRREGRIQIQAPQFFSRNTVREFHDTIMAAWTRQEEARRARLEEARRARRAARVARKAANVIREAPSHFLPPPPIPGTEDIVPLTSEEALLEEGRRQHNCAAHYVKKVRSGFLYIYRVLRPERATLAIVLGPDGFWHRSELELSENRRASRSTRDFVDRWLSGFAMSV